VSAGLAPHGAAPHGLGPEAPRLQGVPVVLDWCRRGIDWLLAQFRGKPRMEAVLCSMLREVQSLEQFMADLYDLRALETARGAALDQVGRGLGWAREPGLADGAYRNALRAVVLANNAIGTPEQMIRILRQLLSGASEASYAEDYPAGIVMEARSHIAYGDGRRFARILRRAKPAGVAFQLRYDPAETVLAFDDDPVRLVLPLPEDGAATGLVLAEADTGAT